MKWPWVVSRNFIERLAIATAALIDERNELLESNKLLTDELKLWRNRASYLVKGINAADAEFVRQCGLKIEDPAYPSEPCDLLDRVTQVVRFAKD